MTFGYSIAQRLSLWDNWGDKRGCDEGHWYSHTRGLLCGLPEDVGRAQQVHCTRRRLLQREQEFHVCTINKSTHTKKSGNLSYPPRIYFILTHVLYICMFPACCFRQRTYMAQGLFNWVLNESLTDSCFQYKGTLVGQVGLYWGRCPSFLECVYFGLLYPSLIFDMFIYCVCVCVCVCVLVLVLFLVSLIVFCVSVYLREFCGFKFTGSSFSFFLYVYTCLCVYIYIYMCVCVCVYLFSLIWEYVWHNV